MKASAAEGRWRNLVRSSLASRINVKKNNEMKPILLVNNRMKNSKIRGGFDIHTCTYIYIYIYIYKPNVKNIRPVDPGSSVGTS